MKRYSSYFFPLQWSEGENEHAKNIIIHFGYPNTIREGRSEMWEGRARERERGIPASWRETWLRSSPFRSSQDWWFQVISPPFSPRWISPLLFQLCIYHSYSWEGIWTNISNDIINSCTGKSVNVSIMEKSLGIIFSSSSRIGNIQYILKRQDWLS